VAVDALAGSIAYIAATNPWIELSTREILARDFPEVENPGQPCRGITSTGNTPTGLPTQPFRI
jgi:hypothetical protein